MSEHGMSRWSGMASTAARGAVGLSLLAGGVALASLLAGANHVVRQLTGAPPLARRSHLGFTPWELEVAFEEVEFPAEDGARLRGWLLTRPTSQRVIVGLHGYRGRRADLLGVGSALWRAGYNVLLFDYRGHGDSDGRRVTLGFDETRDFRSALRWVRQRLPDAWIGALGYSMGGAVAILGAADESDVRAVVADSAFSLQEEVVRLAWRRRMHLPAAPVMAVAGRLLPALHGFGFGDVAPLAAVGRLAPRPLLLIHATGDELVPVAHAERLFAAAGEPKTLWIVPDEPHCGAYFADRVGYTKRVIAFMDAAADGDGGLADGG